MTCPEVVAEITNKRQLRRLVVLPYDLIVKEPFPEFVQIITEFSKKTGDYPSLSATDIKVMALTYQMQKEKEGIDNLRTEPVLQKPIVTTENKVTNLNPDVTGFFFCSKSDKPLSGKSNSGDDSEDESVSEESLSDDDSGAVNDVIGKLEGLDCISGGGQESVDDILVPISEKEAVEVESEDEEVNEIEESDDEDDDGGWITPLNVHLAKKQLNSELMEEKSVSVACMTTDFAMQNVLRQINLNVSSLDGRLIKQLRTYILRCYACFKTTSIMTKKFCPKCGNNTLKKVAVSLDQNGKMQIHINPRRPLTGRGKKYSLPRIKGGKHPNNPILVEDQPLPDNKPTRLARTKNNPLDDDYIAGRWLLMNVQKSIL